jgi:hypothetical protein
MDILESVIKLMDRSEVKKSMLYLKRMDESTERKDVKLFKEIRQKEADYDEFEAFSILYEGKDKNAFYRLKNRLLGDLQESIWLSNYQNSEEMHCQFLLGLGLYYYQKRAFELSLHYFKKAEKKALAVENYSLLDYIYAKEIYLYRETLADNPEKTIEIRRKNRDKLIKFNEIEEILETIEYRIKIKKQTQTGKDSILEILQETVNQYANDESLKNSPRLRMGMYFIASRIFLQNKDYTSLEAYLLKIYPEFESLGLFTKTNHATKLQMLSWLINTLFMNKNYKLSLQYAEVLKVEMDKFNKQFREQFEFFYYNSLIINYSEIQPPKAIQILEQLSQDVSMQKTPFNVLFIYLNQAVLYYKQREHNKALRAISRLYGVEVFHQSDVTLRLRVNLGELLIREDLKEYDTLQYRVKNILKEYDETLFDINIWEYQWLLWLSKYYINGQILNKKVSKQLLKAIQEKMLQSEDKETFLFDFVLFMDYLTRK